MINTPKISIAIPTYEMKLSGVFFLEISLNKICQQSFKDIEVVISDHSVNDEIKNLCQSFEHKLNIIYLKNENNRGSSSANINNALRHCKGEIIKILFQDEYLYDVDALKKIKEKFDDDKNIQWLLTGCVNGTLLDQPFSKILPVYTNNIIMSQNTIGSPSVLTIKNNNIEFFNDDLVWIMDCDYYKRLFDKFGPPTYLNEHLVFIFQHKNQVTVTLDRTTKIKEEKYLVKKYQHEL